MGVRKRAALRGQWYPESMEACLKEVEGYQKEGWMRRAEGEHYRAGIVPHAGWFFQAASPVGSSKPWQKETSQTWWFFSAII